MAKSQQPTCSAPKCSAPVRIKRAGAHAGQPRKFCATHRTGAPMTTLAREGRWSDLSPQTARPQARKTARAKAAPKSQVKQASTRAQKRAKREGASPAQVAQATRRNSGRTIVAGGTTYVVSGKLAYAVAS